MKQLVRNLGILGGTASFDAPLHVGSPNIGDRARLMARIEDLLGRRWLTNNGPYVREFEQQICAITGAKHCMAMCNATVALEIVIRALGLTGEVIIPSFTFIATAHALQWQEITPVFCDIDSQTHNIDPQRIEELITPRTSGIIGVHVWGRACDVAALADIACRRNLKLIFDAAHAFGCSCNGQMIGNFGEAEVFSFHATKFLNAFEGGAVVTNSDELAKKIRLMTNFGFEDYDKVIYIGTNGKMSEVSAAMGLSGLDSMDEFVAVNRHNHELYRSELTAVQGVRVLGYDNREKANYQYVVVEVDESAAGINRDTIWEVLKGENVLARRYFYPGCHRMEPYRSYFPHAGLLLPETEEVSKRVLVLPTGTSVTHSDIQTVSQLIRFVISNAAEVNARLAERQMTRAFV